MKFIQPVYSVCLIALFLFVNTDVSLAQQPETKIRRAIVAANQEFMAAFARGDGNGIAALYSENGELLQPNGSVIGGRQAIGKYWQETIDSGLKGMKLETIEVMGKGDMASEVGRYSVVDGKGAVLDKGKYIVLWKQEKGKWKLHRDIWNSDLPAQGS